MIGVLNLGCNLARDNGYQPSLHACIKGFVHEAMELFKVVISAIQAPPMTKR